MSASKVAVVYSKHAGQFEGNRIELKTIASQLHTITSSYVVMCELDDLELLDLSTLDAVFAVGGDGTVGHVIGFVAQNQPPSRRVKVGIIPGGTGNIFAECLGLMKNDHANLIQYALDVVAQSRIESIDVGIANGTPFIIDVGLGPLATAVTKPNSSEKFQYGMFSYLKPLVISMKQRPYKFKITADDDTFFIDACGVFISNPPELGIGQDATLEGLQDGFLNLCIMNPEELDDYFRMAKKFSAWFIAGVTVDDMPYKCMKVKNVTVESVRPSSEPAFITKFIEGEEVPHQLKEIDGKLELRAMIDGDPFEFTPLEVSILPEAVDVFVPYDIHLEDSESKNKIAVAGDAG